MRKGCKKNISLNNFKPASKMLGFNLPDCLNLCPWSVMSLAGGRASPPGIWEFSSTYSNQGGQIIPTTILLAHPDLKT